MTIKHWEDFSTMTYNQCQRLKKHPLAIEGNFIGIDNLEAGEIKIYEYTGGFLNILPLIYRQAQACPNAVPVAEAIINEQWKDNAVFIHRISCEYGYEDLVQPMVYQILHFAKVYEKYQSVGISDREYEHWVPYAKEALADFCRMNRVYEYQIQGRGLDG